MNKFNMKNTHRLGLKSNSISKLYQTECVKKEKYIKNCQKVDQYELILVI